MKFCLFRKFAKRLLKKWSLNLSKRSTIKRLSLIVTLLAIVTLSVFYGVLFSRLSHDYRVYNTLAPGNYQCSAIGSNPLELDRFIQLMNLNVNRFVNRNVNGVMNAKTRKPVGRKRLSDKVELRILVFIETQYSKLGRSLIELLQSAKFKYDLQPSTFKSLPPLAGQNKGKYSLIIFEKYDRYLQLTGWNYDLLNEYCRQYGVGVVGFLGKEDKSRRIRPLRRSALLVKSNVQIADYHLNENSGVLRIAKAGSRQRSIGSKKNWTVFYFNRSNYEAIGLARQSGDLVATVVQDLGNVDGVRRVLFGSDLTFWLHRMLLLDSISFLTDQRMSLPLDRLLQIDIDDILVGERGTRLKSNDVDALVEAQERLRASVEDFQFNLGFSGKHYHRGNDDEDLGDDHLLRKAANFRWFCHMYAHSQPHLYTNQSALEGQMQLNREFAQKHGIHLDTTYSVAPHHSGVYPLHGPLYAAWKAFGTTITSTEEYPHLRPARLRKGFIHAGIKVLPRQTCGLYTHTIFIAKYPGGRSKLDDSIFGGELFFTMVFNPIVIFMTHMSNYGSDRIALYTFESVLRFLQCWTNLRFKTVPPVELANEYFRLYPEERTPVWTNPCDDKRHLTIWSSNKTCSKMPDFLVIGPQKTGTTALHTFLTMHPSVQSNFPTLDYFEELQFFNGPNYLKGVDWYMDQFPSRTADHRAATNRTVGSRIGSNGNASTASVLLFEKSANYFDSDKVPERVNALLPNIKLIAILINPIQRAYSWYQHARFHNDTAAVSHSFYEVITAKNFSAKALRTLRNRSLNPGCYANHLERWLGYFDKRQLILVDGDDLKANPVAVMSQLQTTLGLRPRLDYARHLRYVPKKGFFCQVLDDGGVRPAGDESNENATRPLGRATRQTVNLIDASNGTDHGAGRAAGDRLSDPVHASDDSESGQVKCLGKSKGRVYSKIDLRSINFLHKYYLKCNTELFKLLVRLKVRIPAWLLDELS